jgi:hypothetical protein
MIENQPPVIRSIYDLNYPIESRVIIDVIKMPYNNSKVILRAGEIISELGEIKNVMDDDYISTRNCVRLPGRRMRWSQAFRILLSREVVLDEIVTVSSFVRRLIKEERDGT